MCVYIYTNNHIIYIYICIRTYVYVCVNFCDKPFYSHRKTCHQHHHREYQCQHWWGCHFLSVSWLNWQIILILIVVFLCTWLTITVNVIPTSQLPVLRGFARFRSQAIESALRENTHHALSEPIGISRSVSVIAPGTFLFSLCSTITAWRNTYVWTC